MPRSSARLCAPQVWAGPECSRLEVGGALRDQLSETGHAERLEDLDTLGRTGASAVRYPILWGRDGDPTDWDWATSRLMRLRDLGIEPIVGLLHHGFGPQHPLAPGFADAFAGYAATVAQRFPAIRSWIPVNEPLTTARFSGLYGWWGPGGRDHGTFVRILLAQCLAQRAASRAIRARRPGARILVTEDMGSTTGTPDVRDNVHNDTLRRWLTFDLLTGRVHRRHPLYGYLAAQLEDTDDLDLLHRDPEPPDILGLNYYVTSDRHLDHRLERYPEHLHGGDGRRAYVDVEAVRVADATVQGWDGVIAAAWRRYGIPLALTEVHLAGEMDDQVAWWREAWLAARAATATGIPMTGVTAWAVFGACDWESLLRLRGRHEPGCLVGSGTAGETDLSRAIRHTALTGEAPPGAPGWWRRPERVRYGASPDTPIAGRGWKEPASAPTGAVSAAP